MTEYYKTENGYIAIDPYKKVYQNGQVVPELVCGRGPLYYHRNKYNLIESILGDQVYRLSDLGVEVPPDQVEAEWKVRLHMAVEANYTARFMARVLVYWVVGMVGWVFFLSCLR